MLKVSNEELAKITQFVASCDDMVNGKFILADVKITKILNMIAGSEELYRYISDCMVDFDFTKEFHRAELKNGLNGGVFAAPANSEKLVAFVFCLLVECDAKRLDFYSFINENFGGGNRSEAYKDFSRTLLIPFRDAMINHFEIGTVSEETMTSMSNSYKRDLDSTNLFEKKEGSSVEPITEAKEEPVLEESKSEEDVAFWDEIKVICDNVAGAVNGERHLKDDLRQELLYILNTIKYSTKYKDAKILSALITAFDVITGKNRSIQFVFGELKLKMQELYK